MKTFAVTFKEIKRYNPATRTVNITVHDGSALTAKRVFHRQFDSGKGNKRVEFISMEEVKPKNDEK